jgi:hypothetical protein
MTLYSYVVARDYGFAPNPFYNACTLATCKPLVRRHANVGDWVVGTGSKSKGLRDHLVFAMQVAETLSYDQYWADPRFRNKRPILTGSLKQAFGDNIYHRNPKTKKWIQENSHHSFNDGRPNQRNVANDTQTDRMIIGFDFIYWGRLGPLIPRQFRSRNFDVRTRRGYKCRFSNEKLVEAFIQWIRSTNASGYVGIPGEWKS